MEKYRVIKEIGSGSFGKVFLVKSKQQGINYVVKKVDLSKLDRKQRLSASKEVELLAKLRHNNIVSYKESCEKNNELNIVLEYCENGDLHNKIKEKSTSGKFFAENEIFDYFVQISLALEYIHSQKILHRDLKTKNIFLTKGNVIKLGDFGIARTLENSFELAQTCIGSPFYLSPEICESKPYNKKSDVWALGCVLYELATLKYAFVAKNVKTLVTKILTGAYSPLPTNMNVHIRSLISCMLKPNPTDRPCVREILEKRFLIKRRATFICKTYRNDFYKSRSRSGDRNLSSSFVKNEIQKNNRNMGKLSLGCFQLNHLKDQRKFNPKAKYNPLNNCRSFKNDRKTISVVHVKNENGKTSLSGEKQEEPRSETKKFTVTSKKNEPEWKNKREEKTQSFENLKTLKLPKVDSEYYDLIAGQDRKAGGFETKRGVVCKQNPCDEFCSTKINIKPDNRKMHKILKTSPQIAEVEESAGDLLHTDNLKLDKIQEKTNSFKVSTGQEQPRKRWSKNTLQREALLAIFNESELLDGSFTSRSLDNKLESQLTSLMEFSEMEIRFTRTLVIGHGDRLSLSKKIWNNDERLLRALSASASLIPDKKLRQSEETKVLQLPKTINISYRVKQKSSVNDLKGNPIPPKTVDDMLSISPSEIREEVILPVQLYETEPRKNQMKNNYFQLLQHEVEHLREKFELNNRKYQIDDLMRFTDNSKNILKLDGLQKYTECDRKKGESVYHNLECLRMTLEQKIGFCNFSQAYEKMVNIINDELDSAFKNSLEKQIDFTKTYVIKKVNVAGDNDDLIKNIWKSIIGILGDKQEYLPDVWELAMSENIYYHL